MDGDEKKGSKDAATDQTGEAGRISALYDPDTVYRGPDAAERNGLAKPIASPDLEPAATGSSIYARGEKKRGGVRMTRDVVKRISDSLAERAIARKDDA